MVLTLGQLLSSTPHPRLNNSLPYSTVTATSTSPTVTTSLPNGRVEHNCQPSQTRNVDRTRIHRRWLSPPIQQPDLRLAGERKVCSDRWQGEIVLESDLGSRVRLERMWERWLRLVLGWFWCARVFSPRLGTSVAAQHSVVRHLTMSGVIGSAFRSRVAIPTNPTTG
jgi:hypothetical protein